MGMGVGGRGLLMGQGCCSTSNRRSPPEGVTPSPASPHLHALGRPWMADHSPTFSPTAGRHQADPGWRLQQHLSDLRARQVGVNV